MAASDSQESSISARPLDGVRVVELEGIGPGPTLGMLLADFGAEVLRVARPGYAGYADPVTGRGKATLSADLKTPEGAASVRDAIAAADVLIDPFRPGVLERLGLGPDAMLAANPRLVFARLTGWGQDGPLAQRAGHDITYIALTGALEGVGRPGEPPTPPLNLIGDMGAGAALAAFGICAALIERTRSGRGQVIDAAIVDGTATLMAMFHGMRLPVSRDSSMLGGGQPFYDSYACADGRHIAVGALEPQFWDALVAAIDLPERYRNRGMVPPAELRQALADIFATRPRDAWAALLEPLDACVAPVLAIGEAAGHPHAVARGMYVERGGRTHPAPSPRLSRTPARIGDAAGEGAALLERWRSDCR
ncbi:CaiB/BaiF CoA transferase family protein [Sphingomonas sp. CJ20]